MTDRIKEKEERKEKKKKRKNIIKGKEEYMIKCGEKKGSD